MDKIERLPYTVIDSIERSAVTINYIDNNVIREVTGKKQKDTLINKFKLLNIFRKHRT